MLSCLLTCRAEQILKGTVNNPGKHYNPIVYRGVAQKTRGGLCTMVSILHSASPDSGTSTIVLMFSNRKIYIRDGYVIHRLRDKEVYVQDQGFIFLLKYKGEFVLCLACCLA